ncbi:hypothetical protein EMPS_00028 [Entomortierella parvispora]|uniref:Uncharacterized protein n=1 Tax=Entomortierella parvispora TaxID=205924 RepID=A0A9P3H0X5_9FUNG|nr:hypothetical protein EMPS_00028 [Entomortierella parvispora]
MNHLDDGNQGNLDQFDLNQGIGNISNDTSLSNIDSGVHADEANEETGNMPDVADGLLAMEIGASTDIMSVPVDKQRKSTLQIELLKVLEVVRPFAAGYGKTEEAWGLVVVQLHRYDDDQEKAGQPRVFEGVTTRTCRENWNALSKAYQEYECRLKTGTGINPELTEVLKYSKSVYEHELAAREANSQRSNQMMLAREHVETNKANGLELLERSRAGPRYALSSASTPNSSRSASPSSSRSATPTPTTPRQRPLDIILNELVSDLQGNSSPSPAQFGRISSRTESESSTTSHQPRTPALKRKTAQAQLVLNMQAAMANGAKQAEMQEQHFKLQEQHLNEWKEDRIEKRRRFQEKMEAEERRHLAQSAQQAELSAFLKNQSEAIKIQAEAAAKTAEALMLQAKAFAEMMASFKK